mmetsp:Transcript_6219/g.18843  ORF Transcript_6219/g.18843 Transcript_6219/m.18843 type:complete len:504 (-) Transcript_6219:360-1871(-)|eukprot:CAMPEP_0197389930 /NCGR_PEP_ID=MMETSP1165-20131217/2052_1 /TAXON_ID=284809 /ORGANISM="Chrysocystis fragilis, Strain CCMP3189" /LENGTH=503 /DNA_ID=CAMNT_0042915383 /DNA_START=86 /DNA_END=1597 /DNA_ORIENTATION=-
MAGVWSVLALAMGATAAKETLMSKTRQVKLGAHSLGANPHHVAAVRDKFNRMVDLDGPVTCDAETGMLGGEFNCSNMNLLDYVDCEALGTSMTGQSFVGDDLAIDGCWVSDIWGWTDPETGVEYALVSMWDGTSIVDLSDPTDAKAVVFVNGTDNILDGYENLWRDIKVVDDVMYMGSEVTYHGIQAYDLRQLKDLAVPEDGVVPTVSADAVGREVGSTHNLVAVESLGWIMGVGFESDSPACSLGIFNVSGEYRANPMFVGCYYDETINYVHDAHCVEYQGPDADYTGKTVCALWAETDVYLVDLSSLRYEGDGCDMRRRHLLFGYHAEPACALTLDIISNWTYDGAGYVHQGWFSDDHATLYGDDEYDEVLRSFDEEGFSRCFIFDVTDLDNPSYVTAYVTPSAHPSIDHNLYVNGDYIYQAAYTSGARVRKIVDAGTIEEVAFVDLETSCECVITDPYDAEVCGCDSFLGVWTYFPYFASGVSIAGGAVEGLFVLNATLA